ncbi:MAG TPA: thiamine pyrophosphate-binding protein [Gemmatimonadaceae bacterium]|nr:thiamine pyrophosphate-binding protein [Gemmatimonadaceae bacterium]
MIRLADYVASSLVAHGISDVFLVTGGGAMHLNDAIGRCAGLRYVACHHEQACSMAAQSYFRVSNRLAAVNVTTGPGGTNAITGVFGGWVDSLGMVVVSGQMKWETLVRSTDLPLRQLGDQEVDIVKLVEPITKYAVMVTDPQSIRYHLEKAIHLARSGRPGPVWLDIPMNVQGTMIDPDALAGYDPAEPPAAGERRPLRGDELQPSCAAILDRLASAERPVIYAGSGVRFAGAERELLEVAERFDVPVVTNFNAHDLIASDHPLFAGRPGTIGDRAGNFTVQNADFVLVIGARLNIRQISYAWESFARHAFVAMVDVDWAELEKPTIHPALKLHADAGDVLRALLAARAPHVDASARSAWVAWCRERRERYPVVPPSYWTASGNGVNPYVFGDALFEQLKEDDVVVTGDATACVTTFQSAQLKAGQRLFSDSGCAPMGFDLPAAVGAAAARPGQRVICIAGDGSIMMNLQELQTIKGYGMPVKLFLYNNRGYHSIRQTQRNFFPGNPVGYDPESGVTFPNFERIAYGFDLEYRRCASHEEVREAIAWTLARDGAALCEVMLDESIPFMPKTSSKRLPDGRMVTAPLEDMAPFLPRDEFRSNMIVETLAEEPA